MCNPCPDTTCYPCPDTIHSGSDPGSSEDLLDTAPYHIMEMLLKGTPLVLCLVNVVLIGGYMVAPP
jgi:hypothetical protein